MELESEKKLKERGIEHSLVELKDRALTVDDVIRYSKGDIVPEEICKTIVLIGKKSSKKVAVLLKGNDRLDFAAVKKYFGEEMRIADKETVKEAAGVEPGAVCPLLLKVPLFLDRRVLDLEKINCGSGNHLYGLVLKPKDLEKVVNYEIVNLTK